MLFILGQKSSTYWYDVRLFIINEFTYFLSLYYYSFIIEVMLFFIRYFNMSCFIFTFVNFAYIFVTHWNVLKWDSFKRMNLVRPTKCISNVCYSEKWPSLYIRNNERMRIKWTCGISKLHIITEYGVSKPNFIFD